MGHRTSLTAVVAAWLAFHPSRVACETIYVDAGAAGPVHDGTSWCTAFAFLQDALAIASSGDTVQVAGGTYRPDRGTGRVAGDRASSFLLLSGVALEGGFAGCGAPDPDQRDLRANEAILSGDLTGDDRPGFGNNGENSHHVLFAAGVGPATIVDGFTVRGGNADGADADSRGGGLSNEAAHPIIRDCTFRENWGRFGGAVNNEGSSPIIENCVFLDNRAGFSGGAVRGWASAPIFQNCLFLENAAEFGGAMWFGGSQPVVRNCTFAANTAPQGNAVGLDSCCPHQPSYVEATNCILWDGEEGIVNLDGSTVSLSFSTVQGGSLGEGNVEGDPNFAPGPLGCHYLSQTASGQLQESPAVDAGSDDAVTLGLGHRTTRSDEAPDAGVADVGYHFPITGRGLTPGDWDRNATVDLRDFASFQECFTGLDAVDVPPCCRIFDVELDGDVDSADAYAFAMGMTGP